jgi:hypothetical protein
MPKKKKKSMLHDGMSLTTTSIGLSTGASVAGATPHHASFDGGITTFGSFMPTMGTTMGAGHALAATQKMYKHKKKKKKY